MNLLQKKVAAALKNMFVADALAMTVHWFYNPADIEKAFPGGVTRFEAAPAVHPSSIMSLHSTRAGGRGLDLEALMEKSFDDRYVVGRMFSSACYITDSWLSVLYLAYKYAAAPKQALLANTNLGGDNVHRGIVLGALLGLMAGEALSGWFDQLTQYLEINQGINALLATSTTEG